MSHHFPAASFNRDISTGPARPHGVVLLPAQDHSAGTNGGGIVERLIVLYREHVLGFGAAAQSTNPNVVFEEYQQNNWQERDGLPQNIVLSVATT